MEHPACSFVTKLSWPISPLHSLNKMGHTNCETCKMWHKQANKKITIDVTKHTLLGYKTFHKHFVHCSSNPLPLHYQYQHMERSLLLAPIFSQLNPLRVIYTYLRSVLILTSNTSLGLACDTFPSDIPTETSYSDLYCRFAKVPHLSCHSAWQLWQMSQKIQAFYVVELSSSEVQ